MSWIPANHLTNIGLRGIIFISFINRSINLIIFISTWQPFSTVRQMSSRSTEFDLQWMKWNEMNNEVFCGIFRNPKTEWKNPDELFLHRAKETNERKCVFFCYCLIAKFYGVCIFENRKLERWIWTFEPHFRNSLSLVETWCELFACCILHTQWKCCPPVCAAHVDSRCNI